MVNLPYVFRQPGPHVVSVVTLSGDCTGALHRSETTIGVNVAPAATARQAWGAVRRAATGARSAAAAATCKDRFLTPTAANRVRVAAATLCLVNVERRKRLLRSGRLALAASGHSVDMVRRRYFQHDRVPGGPRPALRLRNAGYRGRTFAENIGYGSTNTSTLPVKAWMNSAGHRANILHPRLRFGGVGIAIGIPVIPRNPGAAYTMDFGGTFR